MAGIDKYIELDEDEVNSLVEDLWTEHQIEIAIGIFKDLNLDETIEYFKKLASNVSPFDENNMLDDLSALITKFEEIAND